jgi:hypothetical protein
MILANKNSKVERDKHMINIKPQKVKRIIKIKKAKP